MARAGRRQLVPISAASSMIVCGRSPPSRWSWRSTFGARRTWSRVGVMPSILSDRSRLAGRSSAGSEFATVPEIPTTSAGTGEQLAVVGHRHRHHAVRGDRSRDLGDRTLGLGRAPVLLIGEPAGAALLEVVAPCGDVVGDDRPTASASAPPYDVRVIASVDRLVGRGAAHRAASPRCGRPPPRLVVGLVSSSGPRRFGGTASHRLSGRSAAVTGSGSSSGSPHGRPSRATSAHVTRTGRGRMTGSVPPGRPAKPGAARWFGARRSWACASSTSSTGEPHDALGHRPAPGR